MPGGPREPEMRCWGEPRRDCVSCFHSRLEVPRQWSDTSLEVLEVDILWPRWVARIGVTRSTEACFLTADRPCTELRVSREWPHASNPGPSAGGLERARCKEGLCEKPIPVVRPTPPHRAA